MENGYYYIQGNYVYMQYFQEWGMLTFQQAADPNPTENIAERKCFDQPPNVLNPDLQVVGNNFYVSTKFMHKEF
jgi:hypothetical protein